MQDFQKIDEKTGEIYRSKRPRFLKLDEISNDRPLDDDTTILPCGKCEQCRINQSSQYAVRAVMESQKWPKNAFLTLTYDNDHLPKKRTLKKADLQKFWKRLRKSGEKIRYLACGEYGPNTRRPHYHAIVFNYWPEDCELFSFNHKEDYLYTSKKLSKIWGNGYVIVAPVNYETCAYVARYVVKKAYGLNKEFNLKQGLEPEFVLSSRRPGLGIPDEKCWRNWGVPIKTKKGVKIKPLPTFTRSKMREENRELYYKKAEKIARTLKEIARAKMSATDIKYFQYMKNLDEKKTNILGKLDKRLDL